MPRIRPNLQLQKSTTPGSILLSDASNEAIYFPPGANGSVLSIIAGVPGYATLSPASFILSDGTTSQTITSGDTLTITAGNGMRAVVSATDILTLSSKLSVDSGNDLTIGTDGGLYISKNNLLTGATWSDVTNSLTFTFDGIPDVVVPITDLVGSFLADFTIAGNTGSDLINNHETVTFAGGLGINTVVTGNTVTISLDSTLNKQVFTGLSSGTTVTVSGTPLRTNLVTRNGLEQELTTDYSLSGSIYTFTTAFGVSTGSTGTESVIITYEVA